MSDSCKSLSHSIMAAILNVPFLLSCVLYKVAQYDDFMAYDAETTLSSSLALETKSFKVRAGDKCLLFNVHEPSYPLTMLPNKYSDSQPLCNGHVKMKDSIEARVRTTAAEHSRS